MLTVREQFAANLRARREELGLTQDGLAQACGLHRTEISLLERSKRSPQLETIVLLAHGLQLKPRELLQGIS
ncbi:MAG: helix-turn-helix transcriptional regulator [Solirubrobacteraceae bacterium]|jgi:transcriptional regulator with XRE-family HTH domain